VEASVQHISNLKSKNISIFIAADNTLIRHEAIDALANSDKLLYSVIRVKMLMTAFGSNSC